MNVDTELDCTAELDALHPHVKAMLDSGADGDKLAGALFAMASELAGRGSRKGLFATAMREEARKLAKA